MTATEHPLANNPAPDVPFWTPWQAIPAGTATDPQPSGKPIPKLFKPLKIRGLTLQNRIVLSPLCQYSAQDGHVSEWHMAHLGGIISRGPGLSFVEATGVLPEGRITPECPGLWKDSQMAPWKRIVDFAHSQNQKIGIQLAHAGRKASTAAPWLSAGDVVGEELNGWPDNVLAPSAIPYDDHLAQPKAMTKADIEAYKAAFGAAVQRAVAVGFDVIEIHNAHGYLLHSFLSPVSNHRTDEYGGSFENRVRLTLEVVDVARKNMPDSMPLFLRVSATDWLEEAPGFGAEKSWTVEQTVRLAALLADRGVDVLDVSSGGMHPAQQVKGGPGYQAPFAQRVKEKVGDRLLVGTVGAIEAGKQANALLDGGDAGAPPLDLAIVGRGFQKNPGLVWSWADDLEVEVRAANQIRWGFAGRAQKLAKDWAKAESGKVERAE